MTDHEKFLAERKKYVGASDMASVLNIGWGCSRKLFYDKTNVTPDYDTDKDVFRRGRRLEAVAAGFYAEKTARKLDWAKPSIRAKESDFVAASPDRIIHHAGSEVSAKHFGKPGYLEIKVVGRESFFKIKKEGLPEDYIVQVQTGLACTELAWGSFAIYWADGDQLLFWDFEPDAALGKTLIERGDDFFTLHIEHGVMPEPLPEEAKPCSGCPWLRTCRGDAFAAAPSKEIISRPDLEPIVAKLAEVKGMSSEAGDAYDSLKDELLDAIKGAPGTYQAGKLSFSLTESKRESIDSKLLKQKHPEIAAECMKSSVTKTLKLKGE